MPAMVAARVPPAAGTVGAVTGALPLAGLRVVDLSRVLAGPFATMLLADLGADVIKVEPPAGDDTRGWGPPWWGDPADWMSAYFASVNRNKRSVVIDLKADAGRATLHRLLAAADLLVHNYRRSTGVRLGLETDALRARHPRLVIATVSGFPGPADADRPAYDILAQAASGLMAITGQPDGPPTKVGVAVLDLIAGLECAVGALAALVGRRTAAASSVNVSLLEAGVTSLINVLGNHLATGREPARHGNAHANIVPYQAFEARDGHIVVAVGTDAQFARLLAALGLEDRDGRYATNALHVERREELVDWLGRAIGPRDRDELVTALIAADVPAGPVNTVSEALASMGSEWAERIGDVLVTPSPIAVDGVRQRVRLPPPRLGEHTDEILSELS
jgi:crotonobetainyl-CoA:carnitine CoA-transferase CaiB-like acyl-CoA transferase